MAETRGQGTLYRQRNSRFWWYRIGFQGRILCGSTKTTDKREAREVLKQKYRELEAAKGGFVTMPGPEAKRVTVGQLLDELLADYELHGRRSIKGARSHVKRVREELGEIRAVDHKAKDLTGYQIARGKADAAGGTINRELALLRRAARRFLEEQKLAMPRVTALPRTSAIARSIARSEPPNLRTSEPHRAFPDRSIRWARAPACLSSWNPCRTRPGALYGL